MSDLRTRLTRAWNVGSAHNRDEYRRILRACTRYDGELFSMLTYWPDDGFMPEHCIVSRHGSLVELIYGA